MRGIQCRLRFGLLIVVSLMSLVGTPSLAGDEDEAKVAVASIRKAIAEQEYDDLWDNRVSESFKGTVRKNDFIQNMRQGRSQVGPPQTVTSMSHTYAEFDPATGYRGKIYAFDYFVKYDKGAFFERLVVAKDPDGKYRLSGLWANPAP